MRLPFRAPGGDRTINAVIFLGIGLWCFSRRYQPSGDWIDSLFGTTMLILGIGLWFWYSWARWPAAALMLALSVFNFSMAFSQHRFSWLSVVANTAMIWVAWTVIRDGAEKKDEPSVPEEEKPFVSIVLLLRETRTMEAATVAGQVSQAWGEEYIAKPQDLPPGDVSPTPRIVAGETPLFVINAPDGLYFVHNQAKPYMDPEGAAAEVTEPLAREAVLKHRAWVAVDLRAPLAPARPPDTYYPLVARLIVELAAEDCLAVFHPATLRLKAWNPALAHVLRGADPLKAFTT
jgi:hypothetical protein